MTDIKSTIIILCKHLNLLFNMKIQPEMFRLAKYNKSEDNVVQTLWYLLNSMTQQCDSENVVRNVKLYFLNKLKYECAHFYALPENMSYGSRELLIAFAYILSQNYLNKFVEVAIKNSVFNPNAHQVDTQSPQYKIENYSFSLKQLQTNEDFENALQWTEGKIRNNERAVLNCQAHFQKLSTKITESTDLKVKLLSLSEILALNSGDNMKFLEDTEMVSKIVQNHERWLKKQSMFWDWMNSILRLRRIDQCMSKYLEELDKFIITTK